MMARKITDTWLRGLMPDGRWHEYRDALCAGLTLRHSPAGALGWSTRGVLPTGRHGRISLGTWPHVGIAEARRRALQAVAATQAGADPVAAKRAARAAAAAHTALPTVAEGIKRWLAARQPHWRPTQYETAERTLRLGVPDMLARRKLAETGRRDWIAAVEIAKARGAAAANGLYRYGSAFLSWAEASGLIETHPFPRRGAATLAPAPAARERVLTDDELATIWRASGKLTTKARVFVRLLILSGCRRSEVAGIAAGEVDRTAATWTIPPGRSKNGVPRSIALGPPAWAELKAVLSADMAPEHRALGRWPHAPLAGFVGIKNRLDAAAGVAGWCWHDVRRTFRTGLARLGVDDAAAEAAIGHVSARPALVRRYDRYDRSDEARQAQLRWQEFVRGLVQPETGAQVVALKRKRAPAG